MCGCPCQTDLCISTRGFWVYFFLQYWLPESRGYTTPFKARSIERVASRARRLMGCWRRVNRVMKRSLLRAMLRFPACLSTLVLSKLHVS